MKITRCHRKHVNYQLDWPAFLATVEKKTEKKKHRKLTFGLPDWK